MSKARMAGVLYLLNIVTILLAIVCFRGIIVPRDGAATAAAVLAHETSYRLGSALEVLSTACSIAVAALLYELLETVNRSISLLAAFFRLTACAVAVSGYVFQLAPLEISGGVGPLRGLRVEELQAVALLLHRLHGPPSDIVIVFFGFHFLLLGYLIFKSGPRALGVLVAIAGLGALTFLAPPLGHKLFPYFAAIGLLAEVSLTAWLLIGGGAPHSRSTR